MKGGHLGKKTKERPRKRGMKGRQRKRNGRGETFYLRGGECMIYVRVKEEEEKRISRVEGRADGMVVVENQGRYRPTVNSIFKT